MSPELEEILSALYERDTCEPSDRPKWDATVRRLIANSMEKQPGTSHDQFVEALQTRYHEFRRARRKPTTLPPRA